MLALTQCWFTRTHVPEGNGKRDGTGIWRSDCRHCDRPIISWDKKAWHLAEGFNLLNVYQGIEKPFLYLIDTRNDFVVARFPIDHLTTEDAVEAFADQIKADNAVDDPESALALRDSRKRKFPRARREAGPGGASEAHPVEGGAIDVGGLSEAATRAMLSRGDKLTGLPGRGSFEAVFEAECRHAAAAGHPLTVAFVDPDRLDRLNRVKGLDMGDRLILHLAEELAMVAAGHCHISRNRGLEFLLLIRDAETAAVATALERVCREVTELSEFTVDELPPGLSCGVAAVDAAGDPRLALRAADVALHRVKAQGGGGLLVADATPDAMGPGHEAPAA